MASRPGDARAPVSLGRIGIARVEPVAESPANASVDEVVAHDDGVACRSHADH
jgi:hypothetical protein